MDGLKTQTGTAVVPKPVSQAGSLKRTILMEKIPTTRRSGRRVTVAIWQFAEQELVPIEPSPPVLHETVCAAAGMPAVCRKGSESARITRPNPAKSRDCAPSESARSGQG